MHCLEIIVRNNNAAQAEYDEKVKARMVEVDEILKLYHHVIHEHSLIAQQQKEMFLDLIKNIIAND